MITTFKIIDKKAIRLAECSSVPRIMIIFGQNDVGKTTLLSEDITRVQQQKEFRI
jgi:AAA15 family ATPase/GTPase